MIPTWLNTEGTPLLGDDADANFEGAVLEHEPLHFVTYPYEWPFALLKKAALHHLELHQDLLQHGYTLADASAFNIQYRGVRPVFIDVLSVHPYKDGEYWMGYRQFCEQFLNPLLLASLNRVSYQAWYRGALEGIGSTDIASLLPLRSHLYWRVWVHVILHARMHRRAGKIPAADIDHALGHNKKPLDKRAFLWMLQDLFGWISQLKIERDSQSGWREYENIHTYSDEEIAAKREAVCNYVRSSGAKKILDVGCNTGFYSEAALAAGAVSLVGIDSDIDALEAAVARAENKGLNFLPLLIDIANPSPSHGWAQSERRGLQARADMDGQISLAVLHHLIIGRNIPMEAAVEWLVSLTPTGLLEFVPKSDPMVHVMLRNREDVFPHYSLDQFRHVLSKHATILSEHVISQSGRTLFSYSRLSSHRGAGP